VSRRHILAIARKEWRHITRDPMTIFLLAIGPVLMLIILSYATATDVEHVPMAVLDHDGSDQSARLTERLNDSKVLDITAYAQTIEEVTQKIEHRQVRLALVIDEGFADQITSLDGAASLQSEKPRFSFIIDGTDPISAETALEAALSVSEQYVIEELHAVLESFQAAGGDEAVVRALKEHLQAPIHTSIDNRFNKNLKAIWNLVPALIAVVLVMPSISIATVIARERDQGTLEALVATPINKHAILLGKSLPYIATIMINVILMYGVARIVFGVPFRGNPLLYLALSSLYGFASLAIGLLFSILIRSQEAALWAAMLFFLFPGILLSGMFFPVEVFPFLIKLETLELPVVSGVLINRGIFLQGVGPRVLWWNIILLLVIAIEGFEIAGRLFKKRIA
jgi:ABC-2 type transport system permease protein